jgi:cob(I)alamin adenosyltransferase
LVKLDKIYTRGGDKGKTSLGDGTRVDKNSPRIHAFGDVDHANASIGYAACYTSDDITISLRRIQNDLFDVGGDLCIPIPKNNDSFAEKRLKPQQIEWLEHTIDFYNNMTPPLTSFILPGGSIAAASLHLARTSTRKAERSLISLSTLENINPHNISYLNRLSDLLFVLARVSNIGEHQDVLWKPGLHQ